LQQLSAATARLEGKLAALDLQGHPASEVRADGNSGQAPAPPPESPAETLRRWSDLSGDKNRAHAAETIDRPWADDTVKKIGSALGPILTEHHATLSGTDCRSTSCVVKLEWENYHRAVASIDAIESIQQDGVTNCRTFVMLPEPHDKTVPYRGEVILDNCLRRKSWAESM
jgi:hypothetical protein